MLTLLTPTPFAGAQGSTSRPQPADQKAWLAPCYHWVSEATSYRETEA